MRVRWVKDQTKRKGKRQERRGIHRRARWRECMDEGERKKCTDGSSCVNNSSCSSACVNWSFTISPCDSQKNRYTCKSRGEGGREIENTGYLGLSRERKGDASRRRSGKRNTEGPKLKKYWGSVHRWGEFKSHSCSCRFWLICFNWQGKKVATTQQIWASFSQNKKQKIWIYSNG